MTKDRPTSRGSAVMPTAMAAQIASSGDPLVGRVFNDRFRVQELIARGGMGKVYRAVQDPLGRAVALKVLNPTYTGQIEHDFHQRFFLEAAICARLSHPNTVTIFDYGRTEDDIYYIAMEFLEGRNLRQALQSFGPLAPGRALHIVSQVCRSVREAHALGVVHRDLKPANVFLVDRAGESDFVKVLDFGLVKSVLDTPDSLTKSGLFMGSPGYMSPEQIRGKRVDVRTDVYSLGVVLFEMLSGQPPFERDTTMDTLLAHLNDPLPSLAEVNPSVRVPEAIENIVRRCLAKRASLRFADMNDLLRAVKEAAQTCGLVLGEEPTSGGRQITPAVSVLADPIDNEASASGGMLAALSLHRKGGELARAEAYGDSEWAVVSSSGALARRVSDPSVTRDLGTGVKQGPASPRPSTITPRATLESLASGVGPSAGGAPMLTVHSAPTRRTTSLDSRHSSRMARRAAIVMGLALGALGGLGAVALYIATRPAVRLASQDVGDREARGLFPAGDGHVAPGADSAATGSGLEAGAVHRGAQSAEGHSAEVRVALRTKPPGARATTDGKLLCPHTPCDVVWTGADAQAGRRVSIELELGGYETFKLVRDLEGGTLDVMVPLVHVAQAAPKPARSSLSPAASSGAAAKTPISALDPDGAEVPQGYKANPY